MSGNMLDGEVVSFYAGKRVLITGHTGFKGSWLYVILESIGCDVYGIALPPTTRPSHFLEMGIDQKPGSFIGNVLDYPMLVELIDSVRPQVVFHLAAQALVREAQDLPRETFETNVMGTVNILEAARRSDSVEAIICVTSDKSYAPGSSVKTEESRLGGGDPLTGSKAAAEMVISSYQVASPSFWGRNNSRHALMGVASARAGNSIGGGDWTPGRLLPDIAVALVSAGSLPLRSPRAVRPWQHVLDPLFGYLRLGVHLAREPERYSGPFNFGPEARDALTVDGIVNEAFSVWGREVPVYPVDVDFTEDAILLIDSSRARQELGWSPHWNASEAVERTVDWYRRFYSGTPARELTLAQIADYLGSIR